MYISLLKMGYMSNLVFLFREAKYKKTFLYFEKEKNAKEGRTLWGLLIALEKGLFFFSRKGRGAFFLNIIKIILQQNLFFCVGPHTEKGKAF